MKHPATRLSATTTENPLAPHGAQRRRLGLAGLLGCGLSTVGLGSLAACSTYESAPNSRFLLLDGSTLTTADLKGKVTLVNFWATTCVSCVKEMPSLVRTYQKFRERGFETVAVAMSYDPPQWVVNFSSSRQLPFKVALDNTGELAKQWGDVRLTPTTYLVNKQGQIVKRFVGEPDFAALEQLLEGLLTQA
jgi:thiol-disulfide isomerase/thioredoxin